MLLSLLTEIDCCGWLNDGLATGGAVVLFGLDLTVLFADGLSNIFGFLATFISEAVGNRVGWW